MENLPTDMLYNILSRLPVTTLLRCKTVKKEWKGIISSPEFIEVQHRRCPPGFLVHACTSQPMIRHHFFSCIPRISAPPILPLREIGDLPGAENPNFCPTNVLGCNNGIVFLVRNANSSDFIMWNVATNRVIHLPKPNFTFDFNIHRGCKVGIGFTEYDYYVVRLLDGIRANVADRVEVFSSRLGMWMEVPEQQQHKMHLKYPIGKPTKWGPHWLSMDPQTRHVNEDTGEESYGENLTWFDIRSNSFRTEKFPWPTESCPMIMMGEIDGCLCLHVRDETGVFDGIWVKLEEGNDGWVRRYRLELGLENQVLLGLYGARSIVVYEGGNQGSVLVVYDLDGDEMVEIGRVNVAISPYDAVTIVGWSESLEMPRVH